MQTYYISMVDEFTTMQSSTQDTHNTFELITNGLTVKMIILLRNL